MNIKIGGEGMVLIQILLLILYYGNIMPQLPWWVVWFPMLITVVSLAFCGILLVLAIGIFSLFYFIGRE